MLKIERDTSTPNVYATFDNSGPGCLFSMSRDGECIGWINLTGDPSTTIIDFEEGAQPTASEIGHIAAFTKGN